MTIRSKPSSCTGCRICDHGTDFSQIEGTGSSGIMLVGEASGEHEQRDQLPFRPFAPAGGVLERTLRRMGIDRQTLSITNIIRCRPRRNWLEGAPWEYSAISSCHPNLLAAIEERKPRVIVALGGVALRELTGMAGEAQGITHLAGYVLPEQISNGMDTPQGITAIPVIGDFHPAFLRRGKISYSGVFARILQRAVNIAKGRDHEWLWEVDPEDERTHGQLKYQVHPSLDEARDFVQRVRSNSGLTLSYDIETFESASLDEDAREGFTDTQIRLIQFSVAEGTGIALPWEGQYRNIAQQILRSENDKCGHNVWSFDNRVLRAAGEREGLDLRPRGVIHDTLQMFHHWQPDLPAHLQFASSFIQFPFPWKHLAGSHLEWYGCADVDSTLRLYNMLEGTLKRDGMWGDGGIV
jgi:uracil-DNA glycosylase family 4